MRSLDLYRRLRAFPASQRAELYRLVERERTRGKPARRGLNRHDRRRRARDAAEFSRLRERGLLVPAEELPDPRHFPRPGSFAHVDQIARRRNPRRKRKAKKMARTAAQKRAFRKMIAGLKRYKARKRRGSIGGRKRRRKVARRRRTVSARALVIRANPRKGARHMARRHRRRRRGVTAIMVNPRRRHRRRASFRRRRNPSGFFGEVMVAAIPGVVGGGALAFADASLLADKSPIVRVGIKVAIAALAALALRKRHPIAAASLVATTVAVGTATEVTRMIAASNGKDVAAGKALPAGSPLLSAGSPAGAGMKLLVREDGRAMGVLVQRNPGMGAPRLDTRVTLGQTNQLPQGTHFQDVRLGTG